ELARRVPWRADVWLRLGRAGLKTGWPDARAALERASSAPEEREASRLALLDLCDLDLVAGDPARAVRWLDRIPAALAGGADPELAVRRAECALARGDLDAADAAASVLAADSPTDARRALLRARLELAHGAMRAAIDSALRAFMLEAPGAEQVLAAVVASC